MKIKAVLLLVVFLLIAGNLYAANGDLTVQGDLVTNGSATMNGQVSVGTAGVKFLSDGSVQTKASGPTTQDSLRPSRALGTIYRNPTGKPMFVNVGVRINVINGYIQVFTDSLNPPATEVGLFQTYGVNTMGEVFFIVLPNNYYMIANPNGIATILHWIEWY